MHTITYTVDDEPQTTTSHELNANQILSSAGIDIASHYLVQIEGHQRESYQNKGDQPIHMHEHMKFISVSTGPTPVS
ncbi:MAG: hypothetical protein LAO31_21065 [Acidobacteriia bacterium]|nr:hypothetical protein [Terriglobia bacterium]